MNKTLKPILKEPLLHFLLLGAGLFVTYSLLQKPGSGDGSNEIVVTSGEIVHLAGGFAKIWQRPPTPLEMAGLVKDRVREEIYYREAMAIGLDRDDTVIRRRLRQKMEFIADDVLALTEPTDAELTAYLQLHPDSFRVEPRFTFRQVYLNPEMRGKNLARDAEQLLAKLNRIGGTADAEKLGDPLLLKHAFVGLPISEIAKQFGATFAAKLSELPSGQWHGPIQSGYGVHLVLISERAESRLPALAEVRKAVRREWDNTRRLQANEKFYEQLLQRYTVTVEGLESADLKTKLASNQVQ
ncbi:MAG: peptidyl-prolyl cis-trans isomerase [Gammaproteobacteria bacterium]